MTRVNNRNIPDPSDLPPLSKAAWRELVNTVDDLRNAVNGTSADLGVLARTQGGALRAVQETNTIVDAQAEQIAEVTQEVQPSVPVDRPSTPTLTTGMGTITVKWDGNLLEIPVTDNGEGNDPTYGTPIPYPNTDSTAFRHVLIQTSPTGNPDFQPGNDEYVSDWVSTGTTLNDAGSATIQVTPGTTVYVRLVAYSYTGTPSGPSGVAAITSVGITMPDLAADVNTTIANANTNAQAAVDAATNALNVAGGAVKSIITEYAVNSSESTAPTNGWSTSQPARTPGTFVWVRYVTTFGNNTTSTSSPALMTGNTGATGSNGVGISGSTITYQVSSSGTTVPTGTWLSTVPSTTSGQYLWTRTVLSYTDGGTATAYAVARHGTTGTTGTSVSSVTPYYQLVTTGTAAPALPTTNPPASPWQGTEPAYVSNTELYRTDRIVFSNSTFAYTPVTKVSSYTAATQAVTVANLAQASADGKIKFSQTDPGHEVGRLWFQTDSAGNTVGIKISNGSAWTSYALMADQILVPSSVGPTVIADGAITTAKLLVGDFTNLIEDDDFDAPIDLTWRVVSGGAAAGWVTTTGLPGKTWKMDGVGTAVRVEQVNLFAVQPNQQYRFYARTQNQLTGTSPAAYFRIDWFKTDKTASSVNATSSYTVPSGSWQDVTTTFTAPSDAAYGRLFAIHGNNNTGGSWWWGRPQLLRMNTGELIVDGSVTTPKIATNAVVARNVFIGDFTNMASGSDFEIADTVPWLLVDSGWSRSSITAHSGTWSLRGTTGGTNSIALSTRIDVNEGEEYYFEFWVRRDTAFNGTGANSKIRIGNQVNTQLKDIPFGTTQVPTPNVWLKISDSYLVPAGVTSLTVTIVKNNTAGNVFLDDIIIRRKTTGNLIVDGAIDGKTITGALIRTAATGQRLQLDVNGLQSFDTAGNVTTNLYSDNGTLKLGGVSPTLALQRTGSANTLSTLNGGEGPDGFTMLSFADLSGWIGTGGFSHRVVTLSSVVNSQLTLTASRAGGAGTSTYFSLNSEGAPVPGSLLLNTLDRSVMSLTWIGESGTQNKRYGVLFSNNVATTGSIEATGGSLLYDGNGGFSLGGLNDATVGNPTSGNVTFKGSQIQARSNGAVTTLRLNENGGAVLANNQPVVTDGGWTLAGSAVSTGWTAGTLADEPKLRRIGSRVELVGRVTRTASGALSNFFAVPAGFQTSGGSGNTPIGLVMDNSGNVAMVFYNNSANVLLFSATWMTGTMSTTAQVVLSASWFVN